jgi:predicted site-specific integrase-resolvase
MMPLENNETAIVTSSAGTEPLTEADAAVRLGLKVATLRAWRHQGKGPAFVRLGRAIRYLVNDIDEFLRANRHGTASDGGK